MLESAACLGAKDGWPAKDEPSGGISEAVVGFLAPEVRQKVAVMIGQGRRYRKRCCRTQPWLVFCWVETAKPSTAAIVWGVDPTILLRQPTCYGPVQSPSLGFY